MDSRADPVGWAGRAMRTLQEVRADPADKVPREEVAVEAAEAEVELASPVAAVREVAVLAVAVALDPAAAASADEAAVVAVAVVVDAADEARIRLLSEIAPGEATTRSVRSSSIRLPIRR